LGPVFIPTLVELEDNKGKKLGVFHLKDIQGRKKNFFKEGFLEIVTLTLPVGSAKALHCQKLFNPPSH